MCLSHCVTKSITEGAPPGKLEYPPADQISRLPSGDTTQCRRGSPRSSWVPGPPLPSTTETLRRAVAGAGTRKAAGHAGLRVLGDAEGGVKAATHPRGGLDPGHLAGAHSVSGLDLRAAWWELYAWDWGPWGALPPGAPRTGWVSYWDPPPAQPHLAGSRDSPLTLSAALPRASTTFARTGGRE